MVDYEPAAFVDFEADVLEPEAGGVGTAADGDEDDVGVQLGGEVWLDWRVLGWRRLAYCFFLAAFGCFDFDLDAVSAGVAAENFGVEFKFHALLGQDLLR